MRFLVLLGTVGAIMIAGQAMAQPTNSTASQSANMSTINVQTGSAYSTPANQNVHYSGQTNTPDVAGALISGANPCLVGAGVSVAAAGTGVGLSWGHDSNACERRQDAAALYSVGVGTKDIRFIYASLDRLCDGKDLHHALESEGFVCPDDRAKVRLGTAPAAPAPIAIAAPAPVAQPAKRPRPDWCDTVAPSERNARVRQECN